MKSSMQAFALTLPPGLLAEVEKEASQSQVPVAELVRDLVEQGLNARRWLAHVAHERQRARTLGLPECDAATAGADHPPAAACIAKGMQSLREGGSRDGDTFIAELDAELAELARQGH